MRRLLDYLRRRHRAAQARLVPIPGDGCGWTPTSITHLRPRL